MCLWYLSLSLSLCVSVVSVSVSLSLSLSLCVYGCRWVWELKETGCRGQRSGVESHLLAMHNSIVGATLAAGGLIALVAVGAAVVVCPLLCPPLAVSFIFDFHSSFSFSPCLLFNIYTMMYTKFYQSEEGCPSNCK